MDRFGNSYFSSCQTGLENIKLNGLVDDSLSENDFVRSFLKNFLKNIDEF